MPPRKKVDSMEEINVQPNESSDTSVNSKSFDLKLDRSTLFLGIMFSTYMGFLANPNKRLSDGFTSHNEKQANYELDLIYDLTVKTLQFFESKLRD